MNIGRERMDILREKVPEGEKESEVEYRERDREHCR